MTCMHLTNKTPQTVVAGPLTLAPVSAVVPFLLLCCDCSGAPGGGAGFEPVPECSDGAIHPWAVEGPQPDPGDPRFGHVSAEPAAA